MLRVAAALAVAVIGAGCTMSGVRPAKVTLYEDRAYPASPAGEASATAAAPASHRLPIPADGRHVVVAGDSVYRVARLYGVPIRAVIDANDLQAPFALRPGASLRIPQPRVHLVQPGDTIYGISRRHGVAMSELVRANRLDPPYRIVVGETLILPGSDPGRELATGPTDGALPDAGAAGPRGIAVVPLPSPDAPADIGAPEVTAMPTPDPPAGEPAEGVRPQPQAKPGVVAAIVQPGARSEQGFLLPVRGEIVSAFGPKEGGRHNDGVNIAAPRGTPVRAAENGIVAYSGNELLGFGNMVLLKHDDGYMTAYAHNEENLVARGQRVTRGETIARVGSTGNVATPQLHFEIRKGRKAVDPRQYIAALARSF